MLALCQGAFLVRSSYHRNHYTQDVEYIQRKEAIERRISGQIDALKAIISALENELIITHNKQLKDIINSKNIDAIFKVKYINEIRE